MLYNKKKMVHYFVLLFTLLVIKESVLTYEKYNAK